MKKELKGKNNNLLGPKNLLILFLGIIVLLLGFNYLSLLSQKNSQFDPNAELGELYQVAPGDDDIGSCGSPDCPDTYTNTFYEVYTETKTYEPSTTSSGGASGSSLAAPSGYGCGPSCHPECGKCTKNGCEAYVNPSDPNKPLRPSCTVYVPVPGLPSLTGSVGSMPVKGTCVVRADAFNTAGSCKTGEVTCGSVTCPSGTVCKNNPTRCVNENDGGGGYSIYCDSKVFCRGPNPTGYKCLQINGRITCAANPPRPPGSDPCYNVKCVTGYSCYPDKVYGKLCLPDNMLCLNK